MHYREKKFYVTILDKLFYRFKHSSFSIHNSMQYLKDFCCAIVLPHSMGIKVKRIFFMMILIRFIYHLCYQR